MLTEQLNTNDESEECPVCYTMITKKNVPLARFFTCVHVLCHTCYNGLVENICPMCRALTPRKTTFLAAVAQINRNIDERLFNYR